MSNNYESGSLLSGRESFRIIRFRVTIICCQIAIITKFINIIAESQQQLFHWTQAM